MPSSRQCVVRTSSWLLGALLVRPAKLASSASVSSLCRCSWPRLALHASRWWSSSACRVVSQFEYMVLSALSMTTGRTVRMSVPADYTASTRSRLSNVVAWLEARDWVQRTVDPADRRASLATLSDDGWGKVVASAPCLPRSAGWWSTR